MGRGGQSCFEGLPPPSSSPVFFSLLCNRNPPRTHSPLKGPELSAQLPPAEISPTTTIVVICESRNRLRRAHFLFVLKHAPPTHPSSHPLPGDDRDGGGGRISCRHQSPIPSRTGIIYPVRATIHSNFPPINLMRHVCAVNLHPRNTLRLAQCRRSADRSEE